MAERQAGSCECIAREQAIKGANGGIGGEIGTSDMVYNCARKLIASRVSFIPVVVILRRGIEGT